MVETRSSKLFKSTVIHGILFTLMFIALFPLFWMVGMAFTPPGGSSLYSLIPVKPTAINFAKVLLEYPFPTFFKNSLLVTIGSSILAIFFGTLGGFALSRMRAPGVELIFLVLLFTLMIPIHVILVPMFILINRMGLANTLIGLAIPHVASPISIFLARQYFMSIPRSLDEAAIIDGCSWFRVYWQIIMPLSKPMIAALAIFKFMFSWQDFIWPLMVCNTVGKYTITLGLSWLRQQYSIDWGLNMAGATLVTIPLLIVFLVFQRHFVTGLAMTGLKA